MQDEIYGIKFNRRMGRGKCVGCKYNANDDKSSYECCYCLQVMTGNELKDNYTRDKMNTKIEIYVETRDKLTEIARPKETFDSVIN